MGSDPFIYCNMCGAANQAQATLCFACGRPLAIAGEDTAPPSPSGSPVSGALLAGRYRILALVGEGGFGAVYKVLDVQRHEALVALKQINLSGLSPRDVIEATDTFNREVGLLSGLKHPNLPRIYQSFTDTEHWYLAMDFIEGQTLEEYLKSARGGHLPLEEVLQIGVQLCSVLSYLHSQQPPIIFRDVKPANVMRATTGLLYLIDFGIARRFTPGQRRDTTVLGSPGYASPEQYGTAQTTARSDIYSLGATLRFLLTGTDPSVPAFNSALPAVQEQGVPAGLTHLLGQMLELDAGKRPASMEVVKQALQRIQLEQRSSSPGVPPARQPLQHAAAAWQQQPFTFGQGGKALQPPVKRGISRRAVIIGLAGVAAVGGGVAWLAFAQGSQGPQALPATPAPTSYVDPYQLYTYRGHRSPVYAVAWFPDGDYIASGEQDGTMQMWVARSTTRGSLVFQVNTSPVYAVAWSPDGSHIASGGEDGTVQVWNAITGRKVFTYKGHADVVNAVDWSPDGKRIASGSYDNTVQVWDAATGGNVLSYTGHSDSVLAVAWSPDGRHIVSGSRDYTVQVWDAFTGMRVLTYGGHSGPVDALAWSPDGKHIASGSKDSTVQVWDAFIGGNIFTYKGHAGVVEAVDWSPDGRYIVSGSDDETAQVWDASTGRTVLTYKGHSNTVLAVAWSPDGRLIASGSKDSTVQEWIAPLAP